MSESIKSGWIKSFIPHRGQNTHCIRARDSRKNLLTYTESTGKSEINLTESEWYLIWLAPTMLNLLKTVKNNKESIPDYVYRKIDEIIEWVE